MNKPEFFPHILIEVALAHLCSQEKPDLVPSFLLFHLLAIWVMRKSTKQGKSRELACSRIHENREDFPRTRQQSYSEPWCVPGMGLARDLFLWSVRGQSLESVGKSRK